VLASVAISLGVAYVHWSKGGPGSGLYSRYWSPEPVQGWWDPERFYRPVRSVQGVFDAAQCLQCHEGVTPIIVSDWRASRHAAPRDRAPVACPDCHGADHQRLRLPTPDVCGGCHPKQSGELRDEARYGFPSHGLAMERAVDARHFADKPKAEVMACVQCHSVATKCDSCHTRHRFDPAEARRPEACITCHSGPPHPDDDTYFASAHGRVYREEGDGWDWTRPLARGNYKAPACAYCHLHDRDHGDTMGTATDAAVRGWICGGCHAPRYVREQIEAGERLAEIARLKLQEAREIATRCPQVGGAAVRGPLDSAAHHLRNVRLGAGHQSPDYQWWHGQAALDGDLIRLRDAVALAWREDAASCRAPGEPLSDQAGSRQRDGAGTPQD